MEIEQRSELFELIKSLTKGERKTFKLFANYYSGGEKKYLRLFEIIDSQKEYDESLIKEKLKREKIVTALPKIKKYLQELILKSLRFYYSDTTIEGKIREQLANVEIFNSKGFRNMSAKMLETAKQLATVNENYDILVEILNKLYNINSDEQRVGILIEQDQVIEKIIAIRKYRNLLIKIGELRKKGLIRNQGMKEEWDKIIDDPIMSKDQKLSGYLETLCFHNISVGYYSQMRDFEKDLYHSELLIKCMESRPDLLAQHKEKYIISVYNLGVGRALNNELTKANVQLDQLLKMQEWELSPVEKNTLEGCIASSLGSLIRHYEKSGNFDAGLQLAAKAEIFVKMKNINMLFRSILYINLASIYIHSGHYNSARIWNTNLLNELNQNFREGLYAHAKIISLIIHFELESDQLLPYLIRSTYRYLYKRKMLYKTEEAILRFIRNKLPKANSRKELFEFFKDFKTELMEITKDEYEAKVLEYFDYIRWLERKTGSFGC